MLKKYGLYLAWVLVCMGTLSSLFFSDIQHLEPCHLCWYQRAMLFPLSILLGMGAYQGDRKIAIYAMPLLILGALFAFYQILIQEIPEWNPIDMCGNGPSCAEKIDLGLGFITIPMLSFTNFLLLIFLLTKTLFITRDRKI